MVTVSETIKTVKYKNTPLVEKRNTRVLKVINGLAKVGATNLAVELASHFTNCLGYGVQLITGRPFQLR